MRSSGRRPSRSLAATGARARPRSSPRSLQPGSAKTARFGDQTHDASPLRARDRVSRECRKQANAQAAGGDRSARRERPRSTRHPMSRYRRSEHFDVPFIDDLVTPRCGHLALQPGSPVGLACPSAWASASGPGRAGGCAGGTPGRRRCRLWTPAPSRA